eukprot:13594277-Alexandrium_andersonii.AAC.1
MCIRDRSDLLSDVGAAEGRIGRHLSGSTFSTANLTCGMSWLALVRSRLQRPTPRCPRPPKARAGCPTACAASPS